MASPRARKTDPDKITDLPIMAHHTQNRSYVYFEEQADGLIKIGHVGSLKHGIARRKQYALQGANLLAVIPGREIEENELLQAFSAKLARGNERFHPADELLEYIELLLECKYAAPTYEGAEYLGQIDFSIWKPGSASLRHATSVDGQMSLFSTLPVRERIAHESQHFNGMSLTDDWYTPRIWTDLARDVMGGIDLDPASCKQANDECVMATRWYTKELNGLDKRNKWFGRMWINPPYGTGLNSAKSFVTRLFDEVTEGTVQQAVTCLNLNAMCNQWFVQSLAPIATAHCIPSERIEFVPPTGIARGMGSATNGTVFTYVGRNVEKFCEVYSPFGQVVVPHKVKSVSTSILYSSAASNVLQEASL